MLLMLVLFGDLNPPLLRVVALGSKRVDFLQHFWFRPNCAHWRICTPFTRPFYFIPTPAVSQSPPARALPLHTPSATSYPTRLRIPDSVPRRCSWDGTSSSSSRPRTA